MKMLVSRAIFWWRRRKARSRSTPNSGVPFADNPLDIYRELTHGSRHDTTSVFAGPRPYRREQPQGSCRPVSVQGLRELHGELQSGFSPKELLPSSLYIIAQGKARQNLYFRDTEEHGGQFKVSRSPLCSPVFLCVPCGGPLQSVTASVSPPAPPPAPPPPPSSPPATSLSPPRSPP